MIHTGILLLPVCQQVQHKVALGRFLADLVNS